MTVQAFALDASHDIAFDQLGRIVLASDAQLTAQRLRTRLRWHRGEWGQDTTLGVDYRGTVFVKNADLTTSRSLLLEAVASVAVVRSLELERLPNRSLLVRLETDSGVLVEETI